MGRAVSGAVLGGFWLDFFVVPLVLFGGRFLRSLTAMKSLQRLGKSGVAAPVPFRNLSFYFTPVTVTALHRCIH